MPHHVVFFRLINMRKGGEEKRRKNKIKQDKG